MFIDLAEIEVYAGKGGNGCISFRREKFVPKGGPDGGDGGKGGDVILIASNGLHTLLDFKYKRHWKAIRGMHGSGSRKSGKSGANCIIKVPIGTIVYDSDTGELLADLTKDGGKFIIAYGGKGGKGNSNYATPQNRSPRTATAGIKGEYRKLKLELQLIADVGLVGLPNAGKSTLLSRLSKARPKIASYPFTTLSPNLGVVKHSTYRTFVIADIPGLIEGAHLGKGLGHQFLRHIARTRILLYLLDVSYENPQETLDLLKDEIRLYDAGLENKPYLVVYNKLDLIPIADQKEKIPNLDEPLDCKISAVSGQGISELIKVIIELLEKENE